ncbi:hypothetical protein OHC33_010692 [Knufia fluminis]|uniref:Something about silencing protein 4 domain-containing protein n=1 Tax=Knufia fluminis TaxID=191047 RepID=A0AAN8E8Q8_9EURO|nr:hypothetical protein OHC33_010692 [Knufia fluminis]
MRAYRNAAGLAEAPPLVTQDSSISNSPLNSPAYKPQYDQFKRIEEKAQKVVKKNSRNDAPKDDKRKLRSEHGSTRVKTELAQYFPAFDDMLSLVPADPNILTSKTPVVLVDDTPGFQPPPPQPDYFRDLQAPHNSEIIDLEQYAVPVNSNEDPLADSLYQKAHQKAERHEKQMKNGDKERAQHEKYQLERLVDELRGPDWLKTLGISGITDTEKRRYEVKRALFIRETKALIDKFKRWKEEEKRRKLEKQQHQQEEIGAEADEDYDEDHASSSTLRKRPRKAGANSRNRSRANSRPASASVSAEGIDSSEIDALASQQLLEEAKLASLQRRKTLNQASPRSAFFLPPEVFTKPFTTFFEKRHIRDAAVSGRNRGRKTYAFGQEMPELEEGEFELPDSILTEDAIKTSQRTRRRRMRSIDE